MTARVGPERAHPRARSVYRDFSGGIDSCDGDYDCRILRRVPFCHQFSLLDGLFNVTVSHRP